jgi:hypothetical protein
MTDGGNFDGTLELLGGDISLGGLIAIFGASGDFDVVTAPDKQTLSDNFTPTEGRIGIAHSESVLNQKGGLQSPNASADAVYVGDGSAWRSVEQDMSVRNTAYDRGFGTATLSSGTATVDTGISSTSAVIEAAASPVDPDADAKVQTSVVWDDSAGTHKVEIDEVDTTVGGFDANYRWRQVVE